jgi:hypothetical protein
MATVVIGYVPKPEGDAALLAGIEEARRRGAPVVVVHALLDDNPEPEYVAEVRAALTESGLEHELAVFVARERSVKLSLLTVSDIITIAGGVPIIISGKVVAGIGVSGAAPPDDNAMAEGGVKAALPTASTIPQ